MNETFRRFVLSNRCRLDVARLEASADPSAWDRLRVPLAVGVVAVGVFLFATQKELYNAILGVTTAAAVSVPALIRAVGMIASRRTTEGDRASA
jgi:energy-converting hydrogenase Eha subunit E